MNAPLKLFLCFSILFLVFIPGTPVMAKNFGDTISLNSSEESVPEVSVKKKKSKPDPDESFFTMSVDKLSIRFFARMGINFLAVFILIRLIYFPTYRRKELFFTFFIFNFVIFLITHLLNKVDMGMGAAFGLFAVFSMLRYRTENIDTKDMTYLFLVIAIGLVTAVAKASAVELGILCGSVLIITWLLEGGFLLKKESTKNIQYENIELIRPENHPRLIEDLKARTGLNIHRIAIGKVDFLKDVAVVKIYYREDRPGMNVSDSEGSAVQDDD